MSRRTTRSARLLVAGATVAAVGWAGAGTASAHISPDKTEVPAGGYTDVQLLVPHGCDGSPTTKIEVKVPELLVTASPYVNPGWAVEVSKETLDEPVDDGHGGEYTERDATITWTAEDGNALLDGYRTNFGIGFQAPDAEGETLYFPVIQTCEDGSSDWITEWDGTGEEPEKPAPAVTIVAAEAAATPASDDDDSSSSNGLAIAGLVAGIAGLGLGGAAFAKAGKGAKA